MTRRTRFAALFAMLLVGAVRGEPTLDDIAVGYGQSFDRIKIYRLGLRSDFGRTWFDDHFSGFFEGSVNYWQKDHDEVWAQRFHALCGRRHRVGCHI